MHGQPSSQDPVLPVREPPRLDAFGNPLPESQRGLPEFLANRVKNLDDVSLNEALGVIRTRLLSAARLLFSPEAQDSVPPTGPVDKIYSVPRRFDISTLFVVSMAFAFLFATLSYCGISTPGKLMFFLYISGVGFAQAALFHSRAPRLASALAGGVLLLLIVIVVTWQEGPLVLMSALVPTCIFGPAVGYLVGAVCGGVFLVADKVRTHWGW